MPQHQGFGHVTLTVTDLERSADFYNRVFSAQTVDSSTDDVGPYTICMGPSFMLGLRTHASTESGDAFSFARVGLDHMGVHVESPEDLEKWRAHLDEQGIESSGPVSSPYGTHLHIKDPDGIATEFFAANPQG
ncbi:MAG TPA: VOC family protein [Acidimicrobiales bacterium]|nr:VOC family protein [Acidimicrobiales bacterium]